MSTCVLRTILSNSVGSGVPSGHRYGLVGRRLVLTVGVQTRTRGHGDRDTVVLVHSTDRVPVSLLICVGLRVSTQKGPGHEKVNGRLTQTYLPVPLPDPSRPPPRPLRSGSTYREGSSTSF